MIQGRFDFLRTGRLLIGRRPVQPVLVLTAGPDGQTEAEVGQLALVTGDRPQLWICVQTEPERVWARITIKIQKGDSTPLIRHGSAVTPSPEGEGFTEDEGRETEDGRRGALVCAATGRRTGDVAHWCAPLQDEGRGTKRRGTDT